MSPMKMGSLATALPATANGHARPAFRSWRRSMGLLRGQTPCLLRLRESLLNEQGVCPPRLLLDHDGSDVVHRPVAAVGGEQRVDEKGRRRIVLRDAASEAGADQARLQSG